MIKRVALIVTLSFPAVFFLLYISTSIKRHKNFNGREKNLCRKYAGNGEVGILRLDFKEKKRRP